MFKMPYHITEIIFSLGLNIITALSFLIIGIWVARWARKRLRNSKFGGHYLDATLRPVLAGFIFYLIISFTLFAALTRLGIPSTSLLAVFGAAGLAIGLGLKDTLSNIASGVMLLILRPLQVGEFVTTPSFSGTVIEIGLFATQIKDPEGLTVYVPNAEVWSQRVTNFGRHKVRKFICEIGVGYATDLAKTQKLLCKAMSAQKIVLETPNPPEVFVMNFADSAITLSCRCWLPADNWLADSSDIRIVLKTALDKAGVDIPYPQIVVHKEN